MDLFSSPPSPKIQIDALTRELKEHNYNYYVLAEPTISDREFDRKLKELEALEKEFPELAHPDSPVKVVGGAVTKNFITKKHEKVIRPIYISVYKYYILSSTIRS